MFSSKRFHRLVGVSRMDDLEAVARAIASQIAWTLADLFVQSTAIELV